MDAFYDHYREFLLEFGESRKMVLSTSEKDRVSSRMMSVVQINGVFYFQTDRTMKKYRQLKSNPHVALCIDNIQLEGVCKELGHPLRHAGFCDAYRRCFKSSFEAYTALEDERLFAVEPILIERWLYIDKVPYVELFDVKAQEYRLHKYGGK